MIENDPSVQGKNLYILIPFLFTFTKIPVKYYLATEKQ